MNKVLRQGILSAIAVGAMSMLSCSKDSPQAKTGGEEKSSFKPHRIELKLYEGHLHGTNFHYVAGPSEVKYLSLEQTLTLCWDPATSSYKIEEGNKKPKRFVVQKSAYYRLNNDSTPAPTYGLLINYLDEQGNNINSKIGSDRAYNSYQHFFSAEEVKPTFDGAAESSDSDQGIIKYVYKDRDPWDKSHTEGSKSISKDNPLGLKGYLIFNKVRKTFDLKVQLWHASGNIKTSGGLSPYGAPKEEMRQKGTKVVEFSIPITIYRLRDEAVYPDSLTARESDFDADEQKIIESYKRAFGITFEEFVHDSFWSLNGSSESESAGVYWH